jgi:hypothetical protein
MSSPTILHMFSKYTGRCLQQILLKRYYLSTRLHGVIYSTTKLPVHRATTMFRVTLWVTLLLLVLILKKSHEDSDRFSDVEVKNLYLQTDIKTKTGQKQQNESFSGECKVSIYI